jgi:hypothetical protein
MVARMSGVESPHYGGCSGPVQAGCSTAWAGSDASTARNCTIAMRRRVVHAAGARALNPHLR